MRNNDVVIIPRESQTSKVDLTFGLLEFIGVFVSYSREEYNKFTDEDYTRCMFAYLIDSTRIKELFTWGGENRRIYKYYIIV